MKFQKIEMEDNNIEIIQYKANHPFIVLKSFPCTPKTIMSPIQLFERLISDTSKMQKSMACSMVNFKSFLKMAHANQLFIKIIF
jgi:hypothetical protein